MEILANKKNLLYFYSLHSIITYPASSNTD